MFQIVTLVQHIIGTSDLEGDSLEAADFNQDEDINVLDIVTLVNEILG